MFMDLQRHMDIFCSAHGTKSGILMMKTKKMNDETNVLIPIMLEILQKISFKNAKDCKDSSWVCCGCGPGGTSSWHKTLANRKGMRGVIPMDHQIQALHYKVLFD